MPFSYVSVEAQSLDGNSYPVQIYSDISAGTPRRIFNNSLIDNTYLQNGLLGIGQVSCNGIMSIQANPSTTKYNCRVPSRTRSIRTRRRTARYTTRSLV